MRTFGLYSTQSRYILDGTRHRLNIKVVLQLKKQIKLLFIQANCLSLESYDENMGMLIADFLKWKQLRVICKEVALNSCSALC